MPFNKKKKKWKKRYVVVNGKLANTGIVKMHPPLATPLVSGSAYSVVGREYVGYVSENEKNQKVYGGGARRIQPR